MPLRTEPTQNSSRGKAQHASMLLMWWSENAEVKFPSHMKLLYVLLVIDVLGKRQPNNQLFIPGARS